MRYILNAIIAKKSGAGGFQIAYNFARAALQDVKTDWHLIVSQDLGESLREEFEPRLFNEKVHVFPTQPSWRNYFTVRRQLKSLIRNYAPDVVYSILAPSYFTFNCTEVMRCCNAWDIIPKSHVAFSVISKKYARRMRIKTRFVILFMRKTKFFMTQTEEAKKGICRVAKTDAENVCVVHNVLNKTFATAPKDKINHRGFNIAVVGAPASHKNIQIIPEVARILKEKYQCEDVCFITTFKSETIGVKTMIGKFRLYGIEKMWNNVGSKSQKELIDVYRICDIGFFPSLLETFSATLLEYMCFGLPTVISDMQFNTEVMGDAALRFSPLDAEDAAFQIYKIYKDKSLQTELRQKGYKQLEQYENYEKYYNDTLKFLTEVANKDCKK